jgi:hypothetical protein
MDKHQHKTFRLIYFYQLKGEKETVQGKFVKD